MQRVETQLEQLGLGQGWQLTPVSGGCIGLCFHAQASGNKSLFIKFQPDANAEQLACEAQGLDQLAHSGQVHTPKLIAVTEQLLVLEWLAPARPDKRSWQLLGQQLASLHRQPAPFFGFDTDNYCGSTPQPNPKSADGWQFFAEQRLCYQAQLAHQHGLLAPSDLKRIEKLALQLPELIPHQPASLIHGDLWSGNIYFSNGDNQIVPYLIDPAAHYSWAEAELAMTRLFGGFDSLFYQSYQQHNPLEPGWQERVPLYNLYHLLNHLNLFGQSYLCQIQTTLARFC